MAYASYSNHIPLPSCIRCCSYYVPFRSQPFIFLVNSNDSNFDRIKNYEYISVSNFRDIFNSLGTDFDLVVAGADADAGDEHVICTKTE